MPQARSPEGPPPSQPAPSSPAATRGAVLKRRLRVVLFVVPLLAVLLAVGYFWLALHFAYSTGDRAGYVQKFSKKGWVCKTWEGELAMVSLPGAMPEIYRFTVRDDKVAAEINRHLGERVALSYEQHEGLPRCFGETEYFITSVRRVQP